MTTPAEDDAVERAFEALLAGRPVPSRESRLVAFTEAVRGSATAPGRPSAALAELLVTGLLTDQPGPVTRPARTSRRRRSRMLAPALFAKIASAGLAAKAATVAGVAVVGLTTVGFTGNLGPAQHTFATLVDHATPFTAPGGTVTPAVDGGTPADDQTVPTPVETSPTATPTETPEDTSAAVPSGPEDGSGDVGGQSGQVSAPAHPSNYGQQVSEWAHQKNEARKSGATTMPAKPTKASSAGDSSGGDSSGGDSSGQEVGADSHHGPSHGSDG